MRSGYEFAFDPGHRDVARAASEVGAVLGAAVVAVPNDEGILSYAFGALVEDIMIPVLVMPNVWASDGCSARYPVLLTLEAQSDKQHAMIHALAIAFARRCFVGQPLSITRSFDEVVFEGIGGSGISFEPATSSSPAAPVSRAYAVALARAQEAGYEI